MTSCSLHSFYPVTSITDEENICYPNSSLPGNPWNWSLISVHVHHAYPNIAFSLHKSTFSLIVQYRACRRRCVGGLGGDLVEAVKVIRIDIKLVS